MTVKMALVLARGETVLFPMPYVEAERPQFVVTNQRLIERLEVGERVLKVKGLTGAARAKSRPYAAMGALLLCVGLCTAGAGAYFYLRVFGMEAASYKALLPSATEGQTEEADEPKAVKEEPLPPPPTDELPDDPSAEHPDDAAWRLQVLKTRLLGMGLLGLGFMLSLAGLRAFGKRRYFVVCRSQDSFMRIRVDGKVQQDIILATLQAVQ